MFYSVDLLRIRKNKKGRIPACWLAATIKEFVGIGIHKLSKADLERLDVEAACCDIFDGITGNEISNRFSLYLSSQLTFGVLKIFRQQVINVEEACQQLYTSILTNSTMSKKEISSKKPVGKTIGAVKDVEMETVDLTCLFPENEVDKHLIQEELPMLVELGLEFSINENVDEDIRGFSSTLPSFEDATSNNVEEVLNELNFTTDEEKMLDVSLQDVSVLRTPVTPKRKYDKTHDGTPTKKNRKSLSSTSNPSELARSPITPLTARRSIFKAHDMSFIMDADPAISGCVPMNEEAAHSLSNAIEPGEEEQARISVRFSMPTGTADQLLAQQNVDEIIAPPQISDESFTGLSTSDASFGRLQKSAKRLKTPQSKDKSGLPLAAPRVVTKNEKDNFQLQELETSNHSNSLQRKRLKNKYMFDRTKQIYIKEPKTHLLYTRSMISTQPNVNNKILANYLLRLPSTGLKIRATLTKKHCPWAKILQDLFTDMIENCCNACEEMYQESARRNTSANKSLRLSDFARGKSSSRPSTPRQTSSKSGLNLTAEPNVECEVTDTDMLLMPPPLPVQVPTSELIVDENELNQQGQLSEAVQSSKEPSDLQISILTREADENVHDVSQVESSLLENQSKRQLGVAGMYLISESEDSFLPKLRCSESMSSLPLSSESESQHENLIITFEEFYEFLKEMWLVAANYLTHDDELVELELDDILTPGDASIEELIKYFIYCCELETKHKLHIQQDIVYGPVNIIKI